MKLHGYRLLFAAGGMLLLAGCQTVWEPEANFGSTVNGVIRAQIVDLGAPATNVNANAKMDGEVARKTVDSYQKSFGGTGAGDSGQGGFMTIINK